MAPKYCSLTLFKQYMIGSRTDPANPSVYNGAVTGTPDDAILTDCIYQAEAGFEMATGSGYDAQTLTGVQSFQTFVDGNGTLHLFARERGPVTAVTAVEYRDVSNRNWRSVTWDAVDGIILPPYSASDTHPHPESWHVQIFPTTPIATHATGEIFARWSYAGGYAAIPEALQILIAAAAAYIYKRRENPQGVVQNTTLGTFSRQLEFPPDIASQFRQWSPIYG